MITLQNRIKISYLNFYIPGTGCAKIQIFHQFYCQHSLELLENFDKSMFFENIEKYFSHSYRCFLRVTATSVAFMITFLRGHVSFLTSILHGNIKPNNEKRIFKMYSILLSFVHCFILQFYLYHQKLNRHLWNRKTSK